MTRRTHQIELTEAEARALICADMRQGDHTDVSFEWNAADVNAVTVVWEEREPCNC